MLMHVAENVDAYKSYSIYVIKYSINNFNSYCIVIKINYKISIKTKKQISTIM